jgi:phosphonate transport system substrate-binding protein
MDKYKDLKSEDLLEGGSGKFFSEVLFGASHQGAAVNLITGKADVASFCDVCVFNYIELVSGTHNRPDAVYKVKVGAEAPFDKLVGKEFILIKVTPVLNAPFVVNTEKVSPENIQKMKDALTAESTALNTDIFVTKESGKSGLFQRNKLEAFVTVDDAWFNPIRELSK